MTAIITGNGTTADDPREGRGISHAFKIGIKVKVISEMRGTTGQVEKYAVEDEDGLRQVVAKEHLKLNF
jgi:hypothetical protein